MRFSSGVRCGSYRPGGPDCSRKHLPFGPRKPVVHHCNARGRFGAEVPRYSTGSRWRLIDHPSSYRRISGGTSSLSSRGSTSNRYLPQRRRSDPTLRSTGAGPGRDSAGWSLGAIEGDSRCEVVPLRTPLVDPDGDRLGSEWEGPASASRGRGRERGVHGCLGVAEFGRPVHQLAPIGEERWDQSTHVRVDRRPAGPVVPPGGVLLGPPTECGGPRFLLLRKRP